MLNTGTKRATDVPINADHVLGLF